MFVIGIATSHFLTIESLADQHPDSILPRNLLVHQVTYDTMYAINMAVIQPSLSPLLALYTLDYRYSIWSCPLSSLGPWMELQVSSPPKLVTLIISYLLFCRSECLFHIFLGFFSSFELVFFIGVASLISITHCAVQKSVLQTALCHCSVVAHNSLFPAGLVSTLGFVFSEHFTSSFI